MIDDSDCDGKPGNREGAQHAANDVAADEGFGLYDSTWSDEQWHELVICIVENNMASWRDLAALILGHLNPSQVGTNLASSEGFSSPLTKSSLDEVGMV